MILKLDKRVLDVCLLGSAPLTGIGVPIMLAYVYGVVPISLCRGGGCGVSRGKGRGVRIDFDEDDGPITGGYAELVTFSAKWM